MYTYLEKYSQVWHVDFEFCQPDGERPTPICMVARELRTSRLFRFSTDDLLRSAPPFVLDKNTLFVAYYASAELGCFLALGWPMPERILDLYAEFRCFTSGRDVPNGRGLLGALSYFGLDAIEAAEKDSMRQLAMRGGPYTPNEMHALLDYCQTDVDALIRLLPAILPHLDIPRALLRGRYMTAAARIEWNGVPIDAPLFHQLKDNWTKIPEELIRRLDKDRIWEDGSFRQKNFAAFLARHDIPWPRLDSGNLALDDKTFRSMAKAYPIIWRIRELRYALSELRLNSLAVGVDSRNRCLLSAFSSKTGRNQPSNSKFIFGPAVWLRGLIKPAEGRAIAYVDWEQQEFGIAAALSGDKAMCKAYTSEDPYITFAKQAGAVPSDATKKSHPAERERFKVCALATQYGMGEKSLAEKLGEPIAAARELLRLHRETYRTFWSWSDSAVSHAMLTGSLHTVFGWRVYAGQKANPRSLANFPMQANGAEMLRLACCLATEQGIAVCAPIHDAILIEADVDSIDDTVRATEDIMREASRIVLDGFELRTEADIIRYPDRYSDKRGREMWKTVTEILRETEVQENMLHAATPHMLQHATGTCSAVLHPCNLISYSNV